MQLWRWLSLEKLLDRHSPRKQYKNNILDSRFAYAPAQRMIRIIFPKTFPARMYDVWRVKELRVKRELSMESFRRINLTGAGAEAATRVANSQYR